MLRTQECSDHKKSKGELAEESAAFLRESPMPRAVTSAFAGLHAHDDDEDQYHDHRVVID